MQFVSRRRQSTSRLAHRRSSRPLLEGLEDRCLLSSVNGGKWTYPAHITYSLMPDGTSVGGVSSTLFQTMNAVASTATWQQQIQQAAAVWEQVANINLVLVSDNGAAVGSAGDQQGDPNFGDIRIGAVPEQSGTLAEAFLPPPINGSSLAGDILFNSSVNWQPNYGYGMETVAIHEIGHALGMDHSQVQQAVMYATYNGIKQSLNSDDKSGIQSIYGVPTDPTNNGAPSTATDLSAQIDANGQVAVSGQYLASATGQNWYKVTVPANTTGTMVVTMQSTNLSSLSPRLAVLNSCLQGVGQVSAPSTYGSLVMITLAGVKPGQLYYIRAIPASSGATSVGAYGLLVNFGSQSQSPIAPPYTTVASQPDLVPTSSADSTSNTSWTGSSGLLGGLVGGLFDLVQNTVSGVLQLIHIGTLTGWGEELTASDHLRGAGPTHGTGHGGPHRSTHFHKPTHTSATVNVHPGARPRPFHRGHSRVH